MTTLEAPAPKVELKPAPQLKAPSITRFVTDEQISNFVRDHADPQACADGLGQLALDCGSKDNVSCVVIDVTESK